MLSSSMCSVLLYFLIPHFATLLFSVIFKHLNNFQIITGFSDVAVSDCALALDAVQSCGMRLYFKSHLL